MAKVSDQLDALAAIFKTYQSEGFIVSPSAIGGFGDTVTAMAGDARKLEAMLERRLTSADIPRAGRLSADVIQFPMRRRPSMQPRPDRGPDRDEGGDVA